MCFQWSSRSAQEHLESPGAQFDEEFDEVLFSILAVDEQILHQNLRTLVPCSDGFQAHYPMRSQP
jgi:hypothetical protein